MSIVFGLLTGMCAGFAYGKFQCGENKKGIALSTIALLCVVAGVVTVVCK